MYSNLMGQEFYEQIAKLTGPDFNGMEHSKVIAPHFSTKSI
ncbi:hypothetical protein ACE38V_21080 [Cytobacillus sp. Hz8]